MGSIWPGITAFKKKKGWSCEENQGDSSKKRAAWKWERGQNGAVWVAKPAPETKRSQYLCLNSSAITGIRVHSVVSMFLELLRVSSWGSLALCRGSSISPASCIFGQSGKVLLRSKTENRASRFLTHTNAGSVSCWNLASALSPSKFVKPLSFQLFCKRKIIIHPSTVTACWKTQITGSTGPKIPTAPLSAKYKSQYCVFPRVYLKIKLHQCGVSSLHRQTQIGMNKAK